MPIGPRIRANNVYGVLSELLTASASVFNSVSLPLLPVVSSAHAVIVLDPKRVYGDPEIVVVTVHTAGSTVATILRGQYETSPREHPQKTAWALVPIDQDYIMNVTSATRPADPYRSQVIFERDTNRYIGRSTADAWQQMGLFFDPPACKLSKSGTQSCGDAVFTSISWDGEIYDTDSMHSPTSLSRITFNTAGLYLLNCTYRLAGEATLTWIEGRFVVNGVTNIASSTSDRNAANFQPVQTMSTVYKATAGDYVEFWQYIDNTNNVAINFLGADANGASFFGATWIGRGN